MSAIEKEIKSIENDKDLKSYILQFVSTIINQRKLILPTKDYSFHPLLVEKKILKHEGENYSVANFDIVSHYALEVYKNKYSFETRVDFKENVEFLQQVENEFNSDKYASYFHQIDEGLWRIIIKHTNHKFNCNFNDYLKSLDKENNHDQIFMFIEAYSAELLTLNLSVDIIYENSILLLDFAKSDATYNLPLGSILTGIKKACINNHSLGVELFELAIRKESLNDDILSATISGLYESNTQIFYESHLKTLVEDGVGLAAIIRGLSSLNEIKESECELFLRLFDKFKGYQHLALPLLSLLTSILRASNTEAKEKYTNDCFERLKVSLEEENVAFYVLHNLTYLKNYENEKSELITSLIGQKYFQIDKHLKAIDQVFWHLKNITSFRKVVLALISHKPFESISNHISSPLSKIDKGELDNFVIKLLTDNDADKRYAGNDLFGKLATHKPYIFSINILALLPITQYKLWVSITQSFREPKYIVPTILSLVDSQSNIVQEAFICKLEQLSEDYGGHIVDVLENHLDKQNIWHIEVLDRINKYMNSFYQTFVDVKRPIKELDPFYTTNKQFQLFNQLHFKKMSGTIQKGAERNSFLSVLGADTVQLSKGGGFRFGSKREISKLGSFASSFSLPRSFFINPDKFELEHGFESRRNWSDEEFKSIQEKISDEQQ